MRWRINRMLFQIIIALALALSLIIVIIVLRLRLAEYKRGEDHFRLTMLEQNKFFSIVSHELKSPLTAILLSIQNQERILNSIELSGVTQNKLLQASNVISKEIKTFASLVNSLVDLDGLLDISKISAGELYIDRKMNNLSTLVEDIIRREKPQLELAKIQLEILIQENVLVPIDKLRIDQVISNLLSNIIKYAPGKPAKLILSTTGDMAHLSLYDQGPGIPLGSQDIIFERFERAGTTASAGLGLGLFISKHIVDAHHGRIKVKSMPGSGSCF